VAKDLPWNLSVTMFIRTSMTAGHLMVRAARKFVCRLAVHQSDADGQHVEEEKLFVAVVRCYKCLKLLDNVALLHGCLPVEHDDDDELVTDAACAGV